jgi:hypothetical protein
VILPMALEAILKTPNAVAAGQKPVSRASGRKTHGFRGFSHFPADFDPASRRCDHGKCRVNHG